MRTYQPRVLWTDDRLRGCARNDWSQYGEDGLIERALSLIGETNRWCFEIGAGDGAHLSNTKRLRDLGWSAVLIERDERHAAALEAFQSERVHPVLLDCAPEGLSLILDWCGCPHDCDVGVIDVDGPDYWFLSELKHRPRILMVETNREDRPVPDTGRPGQAGITAIRARAESMGYALAARTHVNAIFWRAS